MTNYNDGFWHGWNGGKCPVHPESIVEVTTNMGDQPRRVASYYLWGLNTISMVRAFRVIKEHREVIE